MEIMILLKTEWQHGKTTFNIFMLGIAHKGVASPLLSTMLDKEDNTNITLEKEASYLTDLCYCLATVRLIF